MVLSNISIEHIHLLNPERKFLRTIKYFRTIILKFNKNITQKNKIKISTSHNKNFEDFNDFQTSATVLYEKNDEIFIRIPTSEIDAQILDTVDKWPKILKDLNLKSQQAPLFHFALKNFY